jgi:hypothetical protein
MRCKCENREFPDEEFDNTAEFGWVHRVDPPHTTAGDPIGDDPFPGGGGAAGGGFAGGGPSRSGGGGFAGGGTFPAPSRWEPGP